MKNKGIVIFLIILAVLIVAVMAGDFLSKRPDNMKGNPFEFNVEQFKSVPEELIHFKETKNFKIGFETPKAITIDENIIYLTGDKKIQLIDISGKLQNEFILEISPNTIEVAGNNIFVAFNNEVQVLNKKGELQKQWKLPGDIAYITAIAVFNDNIFVADAGTRKVLRYSAEGDFLNDFDGKATNDALHGFIVPSACFDLNINEEGELWVVNPGMHSIENYTFEGNLRAHWQKSGINIEGFSGCCNPTYFAFLPDGSFVTSEKGMVRVKIHKPSGEFSGVVAPPNKFENKIEGRAPDVAVDSQGNIYALDFDRKIVRIFEPK